MAGHHLRLALLNSALCWPDIENHSRQFWSMHSGRTQQSSTPVRNSTLTLRRLPLSQPMGTSLADAPDQLVLDATCLSAGGQADWFEAIIGKKPLSHVHSSTGGNLRQALTLNCSQPMAITLAGFHPIRCSLFPFSDSHTRRGVTFSQQQSLRGQSLQSNQNHPLSPVHQSEPPSLSQQLLAPNVGGLGGEDEGGAVNSCNRPLWSSGHSPLAAHTRHLARTQSARNQHRFHPDRYCWGFRSSQTEASHKLTPYTLALSGHSRLGQRWNCRLMGEHSPSRE